MRLAAMDLLSLMTIPRDELGRGTNVRVRFGGDADDVARLMADETADLIVANNRGGKPTVVIVPVGPVGQYPILADRIVGGGIDCAGVSFLMMDEFLGDDGGPIDLAHPLSFRGFLLREFFSRLPPAARFNPDNWLCPDPGRPEGVAELVEVRGGVDVCFGGIGLNGHLAFNEPEDVDPDEFAGRPARVLDVAPESRAHMAVNLSCALDLIPRRAVTVGMRDILGARRISLYANRPWQGGVVRLALHGPVSARCPASLVRRHGDVTLTVADVVAEPREVRLR
jgi:glucosamine-6-phosphate deaminase